MPDIESKHNNPEILTIQHIFGKPPGWLLHWGITVMAIMLCVGLVIATYIKMPDVLDGKATLFTTNPPIDVNAKIDSRIDTIFVADKGKAKKGAEILRLESTVSSNDLVELYSFFDQISDVEYIPDYLDIRFPKGLKLGTLSSTYIMMMQEFDGFQHFLRQSAVFVKIKSLTNEIGQIKKLNLSLLKQQGLYEQEVALSEKDYQRNKTLRDQGVIADSEKEKFESKILSEKRSLESFKTQQSSNEVRIEQIKTQINDLIADRSNGVSNKIFSIQQLKDRLKSEIIEWEESHLIRAPFDCQVSHSQYLTPNKNVKAGDILLTCLPQGHSDKMIAQGQISLKNAGKLEVGQKVILELENYPKQEFGTIIGSVADFSLVPNEDKYLVKFELPQPLVTNYKKTIPASQNMSASLSIYTKEYSLLERLFQNLMNAIRN